MYNKAVTRKGSPEVWQFFISIENFSFSFKRKFFSIYIKVLHHKKNKRSNFLCTFVIICGKISILQGRIFTIFKYLTEKYSCDGRGNEALDSILNTRKVREKLYEFIYYRKWL